MNSKTGKIFAVLISASAASLAIFFAILAWTEPGQAPPGGNISAPINTGANAQTKDSSLGFGGPNSGIMYWIAKVGNSLALKTGNDLATAVTRFIIGQNGNVGIGTEAPGKELVVNGDAQADEFCFGDECCYGWAQCVEKYGGGPPGTYVVDPTIRSWLAVAMSANGQYQTAAAFSDKIFTSSNFGKTWTAIPIDNIHGKTINIAMTADGKNQIVTGGYNTPPSHPDEVYVSNNYGLPGSWSQDPSLEEVVDIAMSGNGAFRVMAKHDDKVYYSTNSGANWFEVPGSSQCASIPPLFCSVSVSADGNYAVVVMPPGGETSAAKITYSGSAWSGKQALPYNDDKVWQIEVSKDATHQIAGVWKGRSKTGPYVYVSINSGISWTQKTVKPIITSNDKTYSTAVAISAGTGADDNGKYMIAAGAHADNLPEWGFAISNNEGNDWIPSGQMDSSNVFRGAAISADGVYMTVIGGYLTQSCFDCSDTGYLYRSNDKGVSWWPL